MYKKLVNESLFEFKKGLDPVDSLGMGRRQMIENWLTKFIPSGYDYTITDSFEIDLFQNMSFYTPINNNEMLVDGKLPDYIKFNYVKGNFISNLPGLLSLEGFPNKIEGYLSIINSNKLTSLEHITQNLIIADDHKLSNGYLLDNLGIKNLVGLPKIINCTLIVLSTPNLISLEGLPDIINGNLEVPIKFESYLEEISKHCNREIIFTKK